MRSFGLLRTNPSLTSNVKVLVSEGKLYFESFDSSPTLGDTKYKRRILSEDSSFNSEISKYWKNTPLEVIFSNINNNDEGVMYTDYDQQMDDIYFSGGSSVVDTDYKEEFEYLAPIHIEPNKIPNRFIIFRVDNPGLIDLTSDNFRSEILDKMKVVEDFDLSTKSKLGKLLDNTYNQGNIPETSLDINFNKEEFTYWKGFDYKTGEYISKSELLESEFNREMSFSQGNQLLTDGFKNNGIIYPYIINLKFLYDDTPATPNELRKWSINRYYGYYGDIELVDKITPYKPPQLKSGMKLTNDKVFTLNGKTVDPFERGFKTDRTYYVEYKSNFYLVTKISNNTFKIISDINLPTDVDSNFNLNTITLGNDNIISYLLESRTFDITDKSDVMVVDIEGKFHRLLYLNNQWKILSDYEFTVSNNIFRYYINKSDSSFTTVLNLNEVDINNQPKSFNVYRFNFSEIKDFDSDLLDTDFASYEYEFEEDITNTEEPKLYEQDFKFPTSNVLQKYLYKNRVESIPTGSEFLSTAELYEISDKGSKPNRYWRKNLSLVKWGVKDSISNNDYPYMFNVNFKADDYNRTTNTSELIPKRSERNMDFFYTLSDSNYNFGYSNNVIHQSLSINTNSPFEIDKYFNNNYSNDYFEEIFGRTHSINDEILLKNKYSIFQTGDQVTPNKTLFKGIDISLYDVDSVLTSISTDSKTIDSLNVKGTNRYRDYKFSILLSDLNKDIDSDFNNISHNSDWKLLRKWENNTNYNIGDIVIFNSFKYKDSNGDYGFNGYGTESGTGSIIPSAYIYPDGTEEELIIDDNTNLVNVISPKGPNNGLSQLYNCVSNTIITDPNQTIMDDTNWSEYPSGYRTIFYSPNISYTEWDSISGSYSYLVEKVGLNFNYLKHFIYFDGEYYICRKTQTSTENKTPYYVGISIINGLQVEYWEKVKEYSTTINYTEDTIVTSKNSLYYYNNSDQTISLIHTFDPVSKTPYIIYESVKFNDNMYISNVNNSVLDNGINIYINKKYKNVLLHIYFNDGLSDTYNIKRDDLYKAELQQIVASNIIETINSITNKNGFINNVNYYVINEDGTYTKYDIDNIEEIPVLLQLESPVELEVYSNSLKLTPIEVNNSLFKINKELENNEITSIDQVNYYDKTSMSYLFNRLDQFTIEDKTDSIFRFNGRYSPIFKCIPLFDNIDGNRYYFNDKLKNFGTITEIIKSKVGNTNLLRIEDDSYQSVFPKVDEIGYFIDSHNIFKSTWDRSYYKKTIRNI